MDKQTAIIIIVAVALLLIVLLIIKNNRDRKKLFTPGEGTDPVDEVNMEQHNRRDKL